MELLFLQRLMIPFRVSAAGIYKVQVTVHDCAGDFSADTPLIITGDVSRNANSIIAYPNPSENFLELVGIKGKLSNVQLVDEAGRTNAIEFERIGEVFRASVKHLSQGIYLLKVQDGSVLHRFRVIKN